MAVKSYNKKSNTVILSGADTRATIVKIRDNHQVSCSEITKDTRISVQTCNGDASYAGQIPVQHYPSLDILSDGFHKILFKNKLQLRVIVLSINVKLRDG